MNFQKNVLSVLLVVLVSVSSLMANADPNKTPIWKSQITTYLSDLNLTQFEDIESVNIDFMITEGNEIVVLSTSEKELESMIKTRLNNKLLSQETFKLYTRYTLPIVFDMQ